MKAFILVVAALLTLATATAANAAGGPSGPAFYVDGEVYRTVGTPTDLSRTGGPDSSFDIIYNFRTAGILNVASSAPGDTDFNGGRWIVVGVQLVDYQGALADDQVDLNQNDVLDSEEEVLSAIEKGYALNQGELRRFVCTVNHIPHA